MIGDLGFWIRGVDDAGVGGVVGEVEGFGGGAEKGEERMGGRRRQLAVGGVGAEAAGEDVVAGCDGGNQAGFDPALF